MIDYMRRKQIEAGYQEVNTPEILDRIEEIVDNKPEPEQDWR